MFGVTHVGLFRACSTVAGAPVITSRRGTEKKKISVTGGHLQHCPKINLKNHPSENTLCRADNTNEVDCFPCLSARLGVARVYQRDCLFHVPANQVERFTYLVSDSYSSTITSWFELSHQHQTQSPTQLTVPRPPNSPHLRRHQRACSHRRPPIQTPV